MSSDEIKVPRKEIERIVDDMLKGGKYLRQDDLDHQKSETAREAAPPKERLLRGLSPMQKKFKCDDGSCGAVHDNPHFKESEFYCADCHEPLGTAHDVHKLDKCPTCGAGEVVKNPRARD